MDSYVNFTTALIYGTGAEGVISPNHEDWVAANPSPSGTEWLAHHVDTMLPAFETWLRDHHLPPITAWDGVHPEPWDTTVDFPLGPDLDGTFAGIADLADLGAALRDRLALVAGQAEELIGAEKAPFSYRYWGYLVWARQMRARFNGEIPLPTPVVYDRDGTPLSAIPFTDVFNELHWQWHLGPSATGATPGLDTSAGQRAGAGGVGMASGEEFILFHRDHSLLFSRWLARSGQPPVRGINMYNGNVGWPAPATANPSTWVEADDDPWINSETGDADANLLTSFTDVDDLGGTMNGTIHGSGHLLNTDIADIRHNNYVPRFHAWHGWIDNQLWWRAPRFARWDATTGLRDRVFEPVKSDSSRWDGLPAITIVRDPALATDTISPGLALDAPDLTTGSGTLRMRFHVADSYDRPLELRLLAEVFDDATSTTVPVETIPEATHTYVVGNSATGDDFDLGTDFEIDFGFATAFQSDDPTRLNAAVGFVNSRIRITGTLEVADGSDPGFRHTDFTELHLVQEKEGPEIDLYFDLSSFGADQVDSAMSGGEARFEDALIVVVQDRTSSPTSIAWPTEVADEVKGLITGFVPNAGLFDDAAHAPTVDLVETVSGDPIGGLSVEPSSGPIPEDPMLPANLPQRFTYRYSVVFAEVNDAFTGLATGDQRLATVTVQAADRSGNATTETGSIRLFNEANPFLRDGDTSWLSIDTRVVRLFEGEDRLGATLGAGQPVPFVQQVVANLNGGATGGDSFDDLPTDQPGSALEFSTAIDDPSTGTSRNVHNFALAKVRLQGAAGAVDVRAFFRLFRYTATNLVFDPAIGYRTDDDGAGKKVPLLGFTSETAGAEVISIPFFAEERVPYTSPMGDQTDPTNVRTFAPGPTDERVLYFGAYLDINQDGARLPATYLAANPDGGFGVGDVQSIRSLMTDAHQCMVVEVNYDGDPTGTGDTPASSDNLAQRNLMILYTDNPGGSLTHTVEHSFEVNVGDRLAGTVPHYRPRGLAHLLRSREGRLETRREHGHHHDNGDGGDGSVEGDRPAGLVPGPRLPMRFLSAEQRARRVWARAFSVAMIEADNMADMMHPTKFVGLAEQLVDDQFPLVFDAARWQSTSAVFDELLILWNDLPARSRARLYVPTANAVDIVNLRNLRHAPGDVRLIDQHTLELTPTTATHLPIPPIAGDRLPCVLTIELPDEIRKGQRWAVDVIQLRGGEGRTTGGFTVDIQVSDARTIADRERRLLLHLFERWSSTSPTSIWRPVLQRRIDTTRARAQQLAEAAGIEWIDPTSWIDPDDPDHPRPIEGISLRVVLEQIEILDDRDPWIKGKGEIRFEATVHSGDNGGQVTRTRLPDHGVFKVSGRPGHNVIDLDRVVFDGYVADDLSIEVVGIEKDTFDPDDSLGKYTRLFRGSPSEWFGRYQPGGEAVVDPESMPAWRLRYRIERT